MNDGTLFAIGCGVTFLALGGAYVFLRDRIFELTRPIVSEAPPQTVEPLRRVDAVQRKT